MERERLGRFASAGLVPLGGMFAVLSLALGEVVGVAFGVASAGIGGVFYSASEWLFDDDAEFDLTTDHSLAVNLLQLGLVVFTFVLLAYYAGGVRSLASALGSGLSAPTPLTYAGAVAGLLLGGASAYLTQRWETLREASRSLRVTTVGFSLTFGTYLGLLVAQPDAGLVFAGVYAASRLAVLVGVYLPSRR
ncbi:hypothetical protein NGM10_17150 (plasmid) [Halorussus salilacus]|uniref:hypothetical protein n=1 Tax=Halorussus salilacus TaxID=2953750 RepID=UPI00209E09B8|nr:hypothetical protein [Halorussus salilacus]USZ69823.1 hypothetical protein NGM10_17150 [Halorussus salilacus]